MSLIQEETASAITQEYKDGARAVTILYVFPCSMFRVILNAIKALVNLIAILHFAQEHTFFEDSMNKLHC